MSRSKRRPNQEECAADTCPQSGDRMSASTNPQALRRLLNHMDGATLAKAERISRDWLHVMSDATWRWWQVCIKELPQGLCATWTDVDGDWRSTYYRWQPALRHMQGHPYYLDLELERNVDFLQAFRKDMLCLKLIAAAELQSSFIQQREKQLKGLAVLACSTAERANQLWQTQQKVKQEPSDLSLQQQLQRRQRQMHECLTCSGCGHKFKGSAKVEFTGPLVFDGCNHQVCTTCCNLPECPKCRRWVDKVPPKGDQEVVRWARSLIVCACEAQNDGSELRKISDSLRLVIVDCKYETLAVLEQIPRLRKGLMADKLTRLISKAYQLLVLVHHPDHGGDPSRFRRIQTAATILRDSDQRAAYDRVPHHVFVYGREGPQDIGHARRRRRDGPLMLADSRPSMPQMPQLSLVKSQLRDVHGWKVCCTWRQARGAEATRYMVEWTENDAEGWQELALVMASAVKCDGTFEAFSPMVYSGGQCLFRVTAGNDNGWGPRSMDAAIDVLPAMTSEQRKQQDQQEAADARRQEVAEQQRRARQKANEFQRLEKRELTRISKAIAEVDIAGNLSDPLGMLALAELAEAVSKCQVLTAETKAFAQASVKLQEHRGNLLMLNSMSQKHRTAMLRKGRSLRRSKTVLRDLTSWWKDASAEARALMTAIKQEDMAHLIAQRVRSSEIDVA
eukprot:TRINITY_DN3528_c0_g1_i1.p1 TRINITY_DN3528_c0_g1~~TRINITY_DN3528_c0_g1_i1.p1  ORF type:complete len:678 (-),score=126.06 TRINITY_DN3528_c0_g1_i1:451-2484(-)